MNDRFHCVLCDKSIKIRSEKKHLSFQYHKSLTKSIICKYSAKNPNFLHVEDNLKSFVDDYNKKLEFYIMFCKWKLHFSDTILNVEFDRLFNIKRRYASWNLRTNLISKIEYFESKGYNFSHISEMNITFITDLRNMTYEHYIKIPKSMLEGTIFKKIANIPKLIKAFNINTNHPLIRKYSHIIYKGEIQDFFINHFK